MSSSRPNVQREMDRALTALEGLVGQMVPTLTLNSLDAADAPFLALIVSKLSPIIGNLLERQIIELLAEEPADGMSWVRQDPDFPDALLVDEDGKSTQAGYEVKAWYTMSTELTGRFRESVRLLEKRNIRIVVVAWRLSHIVHGTPEVVGVLTVDALSVANKRDEHYHRPPGYLCVEPEDTTARTRNLQQTNVGGFKWQSADGEKLKEAARLVEASEFSDLAASTIGAQTLATELRNRYPYRLDTNFAKIDRIDHPEIEEFKTRMLALDARGRTIAEWTKLLKQLGDQNGNGYAAAAQEIQRIYDDL